MPWLIQYVSWNSPGTLWDRQIASHHCELFCAVPDSDFRLDVHRPGFAQQFGLSDGGSNQAVTLLGCWLLGALNVWP